MLVADVEPRQSQRRAAEVDRPYRPYEARRHHRQVGNFVPEKLKRQKRRRDAKADHIRQTVELSAKIGGVPSEACQPAIQRIEHHGQKNQISGRCESVEGKKYR